MAVTYSDIKFVKHPNIKYLCVCHSGKGNFSIRGLPLEGNQVYKLISLCDSCRGFNRMVFCFTSLSSYSFKSIIAPISNLLCLYVRRRQHRHICLRGAHKDPERLIVGTEMRSRPYLVLVESQPYFIISWFHALGSPANLLNLQGPWCREALIHAEDVRGQDARKSENGTYLCNFLRLCLLLYFITAAHFLNRQPENDSHLLVAPLKPHYLKTTWHFKGSIQIKVSLLTVAFRPSTMSHRTSSRINNLSPPLSSW